MQKTSHNLPAFLNLVVLFLVACQAIQVSSLPRAEGLPVNSANTPTPAPSPTLPFSPTPSPTSLPPNPTPTTEAKPKPVVVVCFDGMNAGSLYAAIEEGSLPAFSSLVNKGWRAESVRTVDPSLTAPAQGSLVTGVYPDKTGIIANLIHNPNDSFYWYRSGFEEPLGPVKPIWVLASQAGLKTAALFMVEGNPIFPGQTADYTIAYGVRDAYSNQLTLTLSPTESAWQGQAPITFSPPFAGSFVMPQVARVYLYAIDSQDDGQPIYDTLFLATQPSFDEKPIELHVNEWGALTLNPNLGSGSYFLPQYIGYDGKTFQVSLYHTSAFHNLAWPRQLHDGLNSKFGFFPAAADDFALNKGWITPEDYLEMLERSALWMADVTAWVYATYQPDLLFTWQGAIDASGHNFSSPGEQNATPPPGKAEDRPDYYLQSMQVADIALNRILLAAPLEQTTVIVVSDHGMTPVHTTLNLNTVLEREGLLVLDRRNYVDTKRTKALAFASGGSAHIYINLIGREQSGTVSQEGFPIIEDRIYQLLTNLVDPATGLPVFEQVLRRAELDTLNLGHPLSGDLFVLAKPGYDLSNERGPYSIFEPTQLAGQHGYSSNNPDMDAIFIAAGGDIPQPGDILPAMHLVDVAPTIAYLLNLNGIDTFDGTPVFFLIR